MSVHIIRSIYTVSWIQYRCSPLVTEALIQWITFSVLVSAGIVLDNFIFTEIYMALLIHVNKSTNTSLYNAFQCNATFNSDLIIVQ